MTNKPDTRQAVVTDAMCDEALRVWQEAVAAGNLKGHEIWRRIYLAMQSAGQVPDAALEAQQRKIEGLQTFADTVHETAGGGCPWCLSRDHWAGRIELCCAPSSRAITKALDDGGEK